MATATLTTETIILSDEYSIVWGPSEVDHDEVYHLVECGRSIEEADDLAYLIESGQRMVNGGLEYRITELINDNIEAAEAVFGDDGIEKLMVRASILADRHTKRAETELREILAKTKAALAA